jgi:uncharacterized protein (DUF2141 family)
MKNLNTLALTLAVSGAFAQTPPPAAPASAATASAATSATGCATVDIQNVRPQQGTVMVAAYGSADSYGKKPLVQVRVPAGEATMSVMLCGLSGTEVALMLFQDLDGDGKMARNMMGMPTEPWGSSGNPGMFGPKWDTGKVLLDGSAIAVKMSI